MHFSSFFSVSSIQQVPAPVKKPEHTQFGNKSEYETNKQQEVSALALSHSHALSIFVFYLADPKVGERAYGIQHKVGAG